MLEVARCRECKEIKPCIPFRWEIPALAGNPRSGVNHYCPECDDAIEEWLDGSLDTWLDISQEIFQGTTNRQN
ncbi:hypothetical protein ES703_65206 [subsurface metagenome]